SFFTLVLSRGLQGMFGAFISPVCRLMVVQLFKQRLAEVMAKIVPIFLMGPLLGPLIGGAITTMISWRLIFFINIPVGLFTLAIIFLRFPRHQSEVNYRFDIIGFVILSAALVSGLFVIETLTVQMVSNLLKIALLIVSISLFFSYCFYANKRQHPIIALDAFRNKSYSYFTVILMTTQFFIGNMGFITPLYVQTQYHYSAWESGLTLTPIVAGALMSKYLLKYIRDQFDDKRIIISLWIVFIAIQFSMAEMMLHFNLYILLLLLFINGFGIGIMMPVISQNIYGGLSKKLAGDGAIINTALRQAMQAFAISFVVLVLILASSQIKLDWHTVLPKSSYATLMLVNAIGMIVTMLLFRRMPKITTELTA
ncbi:MAG: MFS transporter, partial [Pseudomonadota bacterium]